MVALTRCPAAHACSVLARSRDWCALTAEDRTEAGRGQGDARSGRGARSCTGKCTGKWMVTHTHTRTETGNAAKDNALSEKRAASSMDQGAWQRAGRGGGGGRGESVYPGHLGEIPSQGAPLQRRFSACGGGPTGCTGRDPPRPPPGPLPPAPAEGTAPGEGCLSLRSSDLPPFGED